MKKNIIDLYDTDIFMHTWESDDLDISYLNDNNIHYKAEPYNPINFNSIRDNFLNKITDVSPYTSLEEVTNTHTYFKSFCPMFYGIYQSNILKSEYERTHNFKYDVVIRIRCDLLLYTPLILDSFNITDNTIFSPSEDKDIIVPQKNRDISPYIENILLDHNHNILCKNNNILCKNNNIVPYNYWLGDTLFFGNSNTMDKMCDIYNKFISYDIFPIPETICHYHCDMNNISIHKVSQLNHIIIKK